MSKESMQHKFLKRYVRENFGSIEDLVRQNLGYRSNVSNFEEEYELLVDREVVGKPDFNIYVTNPNGIVLAEVKSGESGNAIRKAGEQFRKWYERMGGKIGERAYIRGNSNMWLPIKKINVAICIINLKTANKWLVWT